MERDIALELAQIALAASSADQTEVLLTHSRQSLTRYAENVIHQNVAEDSANVKVRAVVGKQIGVASGTDLSPAGLRQLTADAVALARLSPPDEDFVSLPGPQVLPAETDLADPATADCGPEARAAAVKTVLDMAKAANLRAAGAYSTGSTTVTVANSLGVAAWQRLSGAELSVVMQGTDSSGYARAMAPAVGEINPELLGRSASNKALASAKPRDLEPGVYPVVLEPEAAGDMLMMLGIYDLGALALQEGRSCMCGKLGEKICGANINLCDDALDPRGQRMAFDFEGVPKQRVDLIKDGVATGVVYDSYTAQREGRASTGHGLPPPNSWGPAPMHMVLSPGDTASTALVASLDRGILVTRFHYTNMIHPIKTVFTGMTRDGTFLVEGGKIVAGVKNLRFTQSILDALSCVSAIGQDGKLTDYVWAPALKVDAFSFSSATEF